MYDTRTGFDSSQNEGGGKAPQELGHNNDKCDIHASRVQGKVDSEAGLAWHSSEASKMGTIRNGGAIIIHRSEQKGMCEKID